MERDPTAIFAENVSLYPVILPDCSDERSERFPCLRLHNGTIWRWVRPIVGFSESGRPHVRIEQRVMAAGPSVYDMMANAALYFGAVHALAPQAERMMSELPFEAATRNFYAAAREGLDASLHWPGVAGEISANEVVELLLPLAEQGLDELGMDADLIDKYLGAISARLASGRTGASWQIASYAKHGDFHCMLAAYLENQRIGLPVHEWPL
jgi:gamma-glutamyl:cysteine ligase YbdK (ATP-grasp superfamily)